MFSKKKKKPQISAPSNFEHRVHTGFDKREGKYVGLPLQWASIVGNNQILKSTNRPLPLVDPSEITQTEILDLKTIVRPHQQLPMKPGLDHHPVQPTNGIVLPKHSQVARSNSLRSSSPPRIRRDLRGAKANVPPSVPEEMSIGQPSPQPPFQNANLNHQTSNNPQFSNMNRPEGQQKPPGGFPKPQYPLPQSNNDNTGDWNHTNNNGGGPNFIKNGKNQQELPGPINVQTDISNNNYLRQPGQQQQLYQQQQTSPGSVHSMQMHQRMSQIGQSNQQLNPGANLNNNFNNNNHNQYPMTAQHHPQGMPPGSQPNQHLINNNNINHQMMNPNSRASSSSGGNASTAHSVGGGSITGGPTSGGQVVPQGGGPSPNSNSSSKQEQRLTHEQVNFC